MRVVVKPQSRFEPIADFLGPRNAQEARRELVGKSYPREELASLLQNYNHKIGNDKEARAQIERLSDQGSYCVVTGQQLGFMGGPAFTILKGMSCLLMAKEFDAIPIFWLATEDHDVAEINHTTLLDEKGNLQRFQLSLPRNGQAVESLQLRKEDFEVIERFCQETGCPVRSETRSYSQWMAHLLAQMFEGTGMVFVEPYLLRRLATPFYQRELDQSSEIKALLVKTTEELIKRGGKAPIRIGEGTNLFCINELGIREKVIDPNRSIGSHPERWSSNAALRPVIQNGLFPTLAYVGGETEIAYHQQLKDYHSFHGVSMPWLVPRISATLLPPAVQDDLSMLGLNPWDPIPETGELSPIALHRLRNELHPQGKPPERVFNWWHYQRAISENLIARCLKHLDWKSEGHHYCHL